MRRRHRAHDPRGAVRRAPPHRDRSRSTIRRRRRHRRTTAGGSGRAGACRRRRTLRARGPSSPDGAGAGQRRDTASIGLRHPEHQQSGEDSESVIAGPQSADRRRPQSPHDRVVGGLAPRAAHRLRGEAGVAQVGGERTAQRGIGNGDHISIQSRPPPRRSRSGGSEARTVESHSIVRSGHRTGANQQHDRDPLA